MSLPTQPYKGTRDFYPEDKRIQKYMFAKLRQVVESFGYQEYDAPLLEPFEVYAAKSGDELVNEQLYSFEDRGGRKVAIRPEMTPSVSRMVAGRRQELAYPLRLYSIPNLWRYERPQRGRLREHWQLNVDLFGIDDISADEEIIQMADSILKALGADSHEYVIKVNSRKLLKRLDEHINLSQDKARQLYRIADKKNKMTDEQFKQEIFEAGLDASVDFFFAATIDKLPAPLNESEEAENLEGLIARLNKVGVNAVFDPGIVRGFDYYTDIIFEVYDFEGANNRSMFGGGRYDGLVGLFGVEPVPTVGFGMGDVTLQNFLVTHKLLPELPSETDVTAILIGDVYDQAQGALSGLRESGVNIAVDASDRKLDSKIKHAVKSGTRYALFIGESELSSGKLKLRDLTKGHEDELGLKEIINKFAKHP